MFSSLSLRFATVIMSALLVGGSVNAQEFPGQLVGFASLPAHATLPVPKNAPETFRLSGKYTTAGIVNSRIHSVEGRSKGRPTNAFVPTLGQSLQGISDMQWIGDDAVWTLTDNGFGAKSNSADAMLYMTRIQLDWKRQQASADKVLFLRDPLHRLEFPIANPQDNPQRYLSGADLDPESFRIVGDRIWIGDEFGPYLVETDLKGNVQQLYPAELDGQRICAPDTQAAACDIVIKRSRGFENMAVSGDGRYLYAMLEGALPNEAGALRIFQFDIEQRRWTGISWTLELTDTSLSVGAMTWLREGELLLIERDDLEGTADFPCATSDSLHCFAEPAKYKRLVRVSLQPDGSVQRKGYVDLLNLKDKGIVSDGTYSMPFWTIEAVTVVNCDWVLIANDNNFPFSASRHPNRQDPTEFALLNVGELLR